MILLHACYITVPSRLIICRQINEHYAENKQALNEELKNVKYVSCTAGLWSSHSRSFLAMTVHNIEQDILKCRSHCLLCRRSNFFVQVIKLLLVWLMP